MKRKNKYIFFVLLIFVSFSSVIAQKTSDKLKDQERDLKKKIKETNELLSEKKNKERLTLIELAIINEQLQAQEELLTNITSQVRKVNQEIEENKSVIASLEIDILKMKKQYGKLMMYAYKHRNQNHFLLYIFSSKSFNQAFSRIKYVKQFSEYRIEKLKMIKHAKNTQEKKIAQLENRRKEKEELALKQKQEKENFHRNKEKQQVALTEMKKEAANLTNELKQQMQLRTALQEKINKAIKDEEDRDEVDRLVARGDKELKKDNFDKAIDYYERALKVLPRDKNAKEKLAEAKDQKKKSGKVSDPVVTSKPDREDPDETPESKIESTNFENNKGKLPWPVEKGNYTEYFGKNPHPTVAGIFTNNNGVEIGSTSGAKVRAVFDGKVTKVLVIDGGGKAVIINHGIYRSVYANMKDVTVKEGDKISIKQTIGTLNSGDDALTELHFEIRYGKVRQNPSDWLSKK